MKNIKIEINQRPSAAPQGLYLATLFCEVPESTLRRVLTEREYMSIEHRYVLFPRGRGRYAVRRKSRWRPESEQAWEEVASLTLEVEADD